MAIKFVPVETEEPEEEVGVLKLSRSEKGSVRAQQREEEVARRKLKLVPDEPDMGITELNYDVIREKGLDNPENVGNTYTVYGKEFVLGRTANLKDFEEPTGKRASSRLVRIKQDAIERMPVLRPKLDEDTEKALARISTGKVNPKDFDDKTLADVITQVRDLEQQGYVVEGATGRFLQEAEERLDVEEKTPSGTLGRGFLTGAIRPAAKMVSYVNPAALVSPSGVSTAKSTSEMVGERTTFTSPLEQATRPEITESGESMGAASALMVAGGGVGGAAMKIANPLVRLANVGMTDAVASGVYAKELPGLLTYLNDEEKSSLLNTTLSAGEGLLFSGLSSILLDKVAARAIAKKLKGKTLGEAAEILSEEGGIVKEKAEQLLLQFDQDNPAVQKKVGDLVEGDKTTSQTINLDEQAQLKITEPKQATPVTQNVLDTAEVMRYRSAPEVETLTFTPVADEVIPEAKPTKPSKFTGTAAKVEAIPEEVTRGVNAVYEPLTKEEVLRGAETFVNENGIDRSLARVLGAETPTAEDYAVGRELTKRLIQEGRYDDATDVIEVIGRRASKQGQAIWSLSLFSTLDDEGAVLYAQKLLNKANEAAGVPTRKINSVEAEDIIEAARKARTAVEGKKPIQVQTVEQARLMEKIAEILPSSFWGQVSAMRKMLMLLNPKTFIRNIGGNSIMFVGEMAGEVADVALDSVIGLATKDRKYITPAIRERFRGLVEPARDFMAGFYDVLSRETLEADGGRNISARQYKKAFTNGLETMEAMAKLTSLNKFEITDVQDISRRVFSAPVLKHLENTLSLTLSVPDRAFFASKFEASIKNIVELKRRAGQSLVAPTKEDIERALFESSRAIFQDKNVVSDFLKGARGAADIIGFGGNRTGVTRVNGFGLGQMILPFAQVPGSLLSRGIEWSPFGIVKTGYEALKPVMGKPFDQSQFVRSFNRMLMGSGGLFGAGMWLYDKGILTSLEHEDYELENVYKQMGLGKYQVNVSALKRMFMTADFKNKQETHAGDVVMDYDWIEPFAVATAMGAAAREGQLKPMKEGETPKNSMQLVLDVFSNGVRTLEEQPLLQGIVRPMESLAYAGQGESKLMNAMYQTLADIPQSFVPTAAGQFVQWYDNAVKETRSDNRFTQMVNRVKSRVGTGGFPPKRDTLGRPIERYPDAGNTFFNVFLNPAFVRKVNTDPVLSEVKRLYETTGESRQAPRMVPKKIKYRMPGADKATDIILTPRQMSDMQGLVGRLTAENLLTVLNDPSYYDMSPEDQVEVFARQIQDVYGYVKDFMFSGEYEEMLEEELQQTKARDLQESIIKAQPVIDTQGLRRITGEE